MEPVIDQITLAEFEEKFNPSSFYYNLIADLLIPFKFNGEHGPWVAGGFITRAIQKETLENYSGDVDIFFGNRDQVEEFVRAINNNKFPFEISKTYRHKSHYSLSYDFEYLGKKLKLQLITYKTFDNVTRLLERFDMFSAMFATDGFHLFYEKNHAVSSALNKQIYFNWHHLNSNTAHPDARYVLKRYSKFISNGYKIDDSELHKFTKLIREIPMAESSGDQSGYLHG